MVCWDFHDFKYAFITNNKSKPRHTVTKIKEDRYILDANKLTCDVADSLILLDNHKTTIKNNAKHPFVHSNTVIRMRVEFIKLMFIFSDVERV